MSENAPEEAVEESRPEAAPAEEARADDEAGAEEGGATDGAAAAEAGDGEGTAADGAEAAESELERALRERDEYLDLAQRTRAELENYKRRISGEAAGAELRGRTAVARDLIPALDNLERALLAAGVSPDGATPEGEPASQEVSARTALAEGVALVYREMTAGLKKAGVESFDPAGDRFDPARHEAVSTAPSEEVASGHIIETLERGYAIGEQVLRPARVVVSG